MLPGSTCAPCAAAAPIERFLYSCIKCVLQNGLPCGSISYEEIESFAWQVAQRKQFWCQTVLLTEIRSAGYTVFEQMAH